MFLEKRVETGEDAETGGDDLELEFLVLPTVDFLSRRHLV